METAHQRHEFTEEAVRMLRYVHSLTEPIPAPILPAGYALRAAAGPAEAEALVAPHRAVFGTGHMTVAERLTWMTTRDYDPALDLGARPRLEAIGYRTESERAWFRWCERGTDRAPG